MCLLNPKRYWWQICLMWFYKDYIRSAIFVFHKSSITREERHIDINLVPWYGLKTNQILILVTFHSLWCGMSGGATFDRSERERGKTCWEYCMEMSCARYGRRATVVSIDWTILHYCFQRLYQLYQGLFKNEKGLCDSWERLKNEECAELRITRDMHLTPDHGSSLQEALVLRLNDPTLHFEVRISKFNFV